MSPADFGSAAEVTAHALRYPFDPPHHSFVFYNGAPAPLLSFDSRAIGECFVDLGEGPRRLSEVAGDAGRTPVLALGSNAAPEQLARKFMTRTTIEPEVIPVVRAQLADFDVVFSGHFTSYGSVPATLLHLPGSEVGVHITYLTEAQLSVMHASEAAGRNYAFVRLHGLRLTTEFGETLASAHCYISQHDMLIDGGSAMGLASSTVAGSALPRLDQAGILDYCRGLLAPDHALDVFVMTIVQDDALRRRRIAALRPHTAKFTYGPAEVLIGRLGGI